MVWRKEFETTATHSDSHGPAPASRPGASPLTRLSTWAQTARIPAVAGCILIALGLVLIRQPSTGDLSWGWLQDAISAVFHNPVNIVRGSGLILIGMILAGNGLSRAVPADSEG